MRTAADMIERYPPDQLRGKASCLPQIEEAMKEGIRPEDLLRAVQAYANDSAGFTREPLPEVLRGNPDRTEALIDASRHQWTYRADVISFAATDAPTEEQQGEVMDHFERLAFAGLDPTQYDVLWVRHTHEDRVELHFCTPRLELTSGRSLNIAPPGYENAFDSLRDGMNQRHGWADPMELERTQEVRDTIETPTRAQGRDELHAWVLDQVSVGLITDRGSMLDALTDAGFDIPRAGKAYLTAQDPDTGERWRLKGDIFHENWQSNPVEREAERGARHHQGRTRRLDLVSAQELQDRFEEHCGRRAAYHRERYAPLSDRDSEPVRDTAEIDPPLADDLTLADRGDGVDGDRLDDGRELFLDGASDTFGADRDGPDTDRTARGDLADPGPIEDKATHLHDGQATRDLHSNRGGLDDPTDSLGTQLTRLRRAVGDGLRGLRAGLDRLGETLDRQDREGADWLERLRDLAHSFAGRIHEGLEWIAERRGELQNAGRELAAELDLNESRRREIEGQLDSQEAHAERGLRH
ncbi:MAG: relaxase/mobilization nuclease domain-containing protein [Paracoccaceae bacterium]